MRAHLAKGALADTSEENEVEEIDVSVKVDDLARGMGDEQDIRRAD